MLEKEPTLKLSDLIDINFLQEFQDVFATTTNVASITVDDSGSITKPSNFTDFCIKYTRGSALGLKRCVDCDIKWGKLAAVRGEPVIYDCHTGLTDFAVPIIVNGKHIASILGGQVLTEPPNEEHFREIARQLEINEDEYIEAVKKIKIVPKETVKAAAQLLFLVANSISEIGLKNLKLKEKTKREALYRHVMETIKSTLDIDETKTQIVNIIGRSLSADRCFIMEYDKTNDNFFVIHDEYLSSDKVQPYKGTDVNKDVPNFVAALKKGKNVIINNKEICMDMDTKEFDNEQEAIERLSVTAAFAFPLYYFNDFLGALAIHYLDHGHQISNEDIDFLSTIANQMAVAIHQANLFKDTQLRTEREQLYRGILETVRSSLDIEKTKKEIVEVVCKTLDADRCFIVDYDKTSNKFLTVKDEYLSSNDILGFEGVDVNTEIPNIANAVKNGKNLIINDREIFLESDNKNFDLERKAIEKFGVNSAFAFPLYYIDELLGALAIHYVKTHHTISDEEINLLNNISSQISLAIHQANLYDLLKQKSKVQDAILNNMPFMAWLKDENGVLLAANEAYKKSCNLNQEDIIGKTDYDFFPKEYAESYTSEDRIVMETKQTLTSEDLIWGPDGERWHETSKSPILDKKGNVIGTVGISQDITERKDAETELLQRHEKLVKATKRERLSRIIIEKIRSTLDINEVFDLICSELLNIYNVERAFIVQFKKTNHHYEFDIKKELKSGAEINGLQDGKDNTQTVEYWGNVLLEDGKKIVIDNIEESDTPDYFKETYKDMGVKSIMGIAIKKGDDSWGWVGVAEYNHHRHWTEDEVNLLEAISSQIHVAIKQAELHQITQLDAQREIILRKIVETIRSTIDIDLVKHEIVSEIGTFWNADRVAFVDYDDYKKNYVTLEGNEYRSSESVKTFVGYDFAATPGFTEYIIDVHLAGKDIIFGDLDEYLKENNLENNAIKNFFTEMKDISCIAINISYGDNFYGTLVVTFEHKREIIEEDINFIKTLANQVGIATYQSTLYKRERETAQREVILRKTIESIRSSIDIESVKHEMVTQIGTFLNADRVAFADYNFQKENYTINEGNEYRSSDGVKTFVGYDFAATPGFIEAIRELHLTGNNIIFSDLDKYLEEKNLQGKGIDRFYREMGFNSSMAINISYGDNFYGNLVVTFEQKKEITKEDIQFLKTLADQSGNAIYQSTLYKKEKESAEREKFIGNVVTKAISTFDINQIKQIVKEIGVVTKADRCYFVEVDLEEIKGKPIDENSEYLASEDIKSAIGYDFGQDEVKSFVETYLQTKELVVFDYEKILQEQDEKYDGIKKYINRFDLKSGIGIPFIYKGKLTAVIAIEYIKEKVLPSNDELDFLRILANQTGMVFEQIHLYEETKKIAQREALLRKIIETLRSSLDINKVKKKLVIEIGQAFKADRCFFRSYDRVNDKVLAPDFEYLASDDIKSLLSAEIDQEAIKYFVSQSIKQKDRFYPIVVDEKFAENTPVERYVESSEFKVDYAIPIINRQNELSWLVLHYIKEDPKLSEDDKKALETMAYQIDTAFEQMQLYQETKKIAKRESLLRSITEKIRRSLDIDEILSFICEETTKLFNVQRTAITVFPDRKNYEKFIVKKEYKVSKDIRGTEQLNFTKEIFAYWGHNIIETRQVVAFDNIEESDTPSYFKDSYSAVGIKSIMGTSIRKDKDVWGTMVLSEYHQYRQWSEEEKSLLVSIASQVYIAISQAELFEKEKKTAENEKALREIMLASTSTSELKEALNAIVTKAGKLLMADRCFFVEFDPTGNSNLDIKDYAEYLSSPEIKSHTTRLPAGFETGVLRSRTLNKITEYSDDITKDDLPDETKHLLIDDMSVKSYIKAPVYHGDIVYGSIVFHYVKELKLITQEDIDVANAIANQSAIVIHKAKLYEITQAQAERETLLRKTFETMRSSLDIDNIKTNIVTEVCRALGADRCFIIEYDKDRDEFSVISDEYLASENIPSYKGTNIHQDAPNFAAVLKKGENIIINNKEIYVDPDPQKVDAERETIEKYKVNSAFAFPLYYSSELLGAMAIHYVDREHTIVNDEINLLNIIANQISVAIHQAKLYKITQVQAEREKLSRNIVEILRSSLDKKTIKRLFVKNIGKYFNADRVLFSDYDPVAKMYYPVDEYSEYLSGPEVKSFIGYDWSCDEAREYIQPLLEKRELKIFEWGEYIESNPKNSGFISLFENANVKSSYNFPVLYQDKIMGFFCIEFTHKASRFSEEDISRLRSMCTQSGIALYQAELFQKSQDSDKIKGQFIANISNKFREPLNHIIEFSSRLPKAPVDCEKQTEYLNDINETGKKLLDFTNYIAKVSEDGTLQDEKLN